MSVSNRLTKKDREILAINCAASLFADFMDVSFRGPNWTPEIMPRLITGYVGTQAYLYGIGKGKSLDHMVGVALTFYARYLEAPMRKSQHRYCMECGGRLLLSVSAISAAP